MKIPLNMLKKIPLIKPIAVLLLLYLFLSAITLMSTAFGLLGKSATTAILDVTASPVTALFIGILVTALVQSSSVTTSMVVGFVSAGTLSIATAIPIIMGANIGTTVTNAIVSVGHIGNKYEYRRAFAGAIIHDFFNIIAVAVLFPLELATGILQKSAGFLSGIFYGSHTSVVYHSPIKKIAKIIPTYLKDLFINNWQVSTKIAGIICLILSFALIFLTLAGLVKIMRSVMLDKIERILNDFLGKSALIAITVGAIITMTVQSSSITTSLLVPMLGTGIITLETAFPITLGANVGTTITAILAALAGNAAGLTVAFVHLLFNIFGILIVYPVKRIRRIPLLWATLLARYTQRNKKLLAILILGTFFAIPLLVIFLSKLF